MGRKKKFELIEALEITDISAEGKAVGKHNGLVVFADGLVPGDIAKVQPFKKKKSFLLANTLEIIRPSPQRVSAKCSHFGTCGGCKWQNFDYEAQLQFKEKQVNQNLTKLGDLVIEKTLPILGCENTFYYRNKLEYTFSQQRWLTSEEINANEGESIEKRGLGFHIPGKFDKILDIDNCYLQAAPSNDIRIFIKDFSIKHNKSFFNLRTQEGHLRNLLIRSNLAGDFFVVLSITEKDDSFIDILARELQENFPAISTFGYFINNKANDTYYDLDFVKVYGNNFLTEKLGEISYKIGPKSFFQTNTEQCKKLYDKVVELAGIEKSDLVYDLYCGLGTIGLYVAKAAAKVVGIESIQEAVDLAQENAKMNNISNATFYCGDMKTLFSDDFIHKNGKPEVLITDPPRAGMHEQVVQQILKLSPKKIVYVSCNAATQARDVAMLSPLYHISVSQAVDMFPHTHHVENIMLLSLKND